MKRQVPAWLSLMLIATSAGLLLGVTNAVTAPAIARQSLAAAEASRIAVFPGAESFQALALPENAVVDSCYEALQNGAVVGHVGATTVKGYGGDIEITIGLDENAMITGIAVGGDDFSESPGLGARTREDAFTSQFIQATAPVTLGKDVDSVTGASISSGAVVSGVNRIVKYIENLGKDASETDLYHNAVGQGDVELPTDGTVERAYRRADGGFIVFASAKGFHGDIHGVVLLDQDGVITRVAIDETNFNETAGLGERVLEEGFLRQFNGLSGILDVAPGGYGAGDGDAVSAATAEAVESIDGASAATVETTEVADGTSAATVEPAEVADGTSAATVEATGDADATSSASVVIEKIEGANASVDGVSGATYSSAAVAKAVNAALAFVKSYLSATA